VTLSNITSQVGGTATGYRLADSTRLTVQFAFVNAGSGQPVGMDVVAVSDSQILRFGAAPGTGGIGNLDPGLRLDAATHNVVVREASVQNINGVPLVIAGSHNSVVHSFFGAATTGIRVEAGAVGNVLARNEIARNRGVGIDLAGSGTAVTNNSIVDNCSAGIRVGAATTATVIENNSFRDNGGLGINCTAGMPDRFAVAAYGPAVIDYNVLLQLPGTFYAWQRPVALTLAEFRSVSGQAAHDLEAREYDELTTLAIDSADSAAVGWDTGYPADQAYDDPAYANTGAGPNSYADRGNREIYRVPIPTFSAGAAGPQGVGGRTMTFDASRAQAGSAPIATYFFIFGDGTAITSSTPIVRHTYTPGGVWRSVTFRVTDTLGHWAENSLLIWVPAETKPQPRCSTAPACRPEHSPR
jgi:parallel beta-helix repeat protein